MHAIRRPLRRNREDMKGPYIGPRPFDWNDKEDASRFFGRDAEASELRFRVHANPVLVLYAHSGAGKTSLLNAKLIPDLTKDGYFVLPPLRVRAVHEAGGTSAATKRSHSYYLIHSWAQLAHSEKAAALFPKILGDLLKTESEVANNFKDLFAKLPEKLRPVVILDQFEEFFTTAIFTRDQQRLFFEEVADCVQRYPSLRFVFALRSEWLALFDQCATQIPTSMRSRFYLEPLKAKAAHEAIIKPVELFGWTFETAGAEKLTQALRSKREEVSPGRFDTVQGEHIEPVQLQIVCQDLWERVQRTNAGTKTIGENDIGSVDDPLGDYYAKAVAHTAEVTKAKEWRIRGWVESNLITEARTRGKVFRGESTAAGITNQVPDELEKARLVRCERESGSWYELVHDSFIVPILESNLKWRTQLSGAELFAQELGVRAYNKEPLLNPVELTQAKILLEGDTAVSDESNQLIRELVSKSEAELARQAEEREQRIRDQEKLQKAREAMQRLHQKIWLGASAAIIIALIILCVVVYQRSRLEKKHAVVAIAETLEKHITNFLTSDKNKGKNPTPGLLAAVDAIALCLKEDVQPPPDSVAALRLAMQKTSAFISPEPAKSAPLGSAPDFVPALSSPDGKFTVTVEFGRIPVLWNNWSFSSMKLHKVDDGIVVVGFSPDSKKLAVGTTKKAILVWDLTRKPRGAWDIFRAMPSPSPGRDLLGELNISAASASTQQYYKGDPQKKDAPWEDYDYMVRKSLANAVRLITRPYAEGERDDFPALISESKEKILTDRVGLARSEAERDVERAKKTIAAAFREFHAGEIDSGSILSDMYVMTANLEIKAPDYLAAASHLERAQAINPALQAQQKADALKHLQKYVDQAKKGDFVAARQSKDAALNLDGPFIRSIAAGIDSNSPELERESRFLDEAQKLVDQANDAARSGDIETARAKYNEAKIKAPRTFDTLNPETEIEKNAPQAPGQNKGSLGDPPPGT